MTLLITQTLIEILKDCPNGLPADKLKREVQDRVHESDLRIEKMIQSGVDGGLFVLGDKLHICLNTETRDITQKIRARVSTINSTVARLGLELRQIQEECNHQGDLQYTYDGDSGNYDKSQDVYWIDWKCNDCGKRWTTSQDNGWNLTHFYPNAKEVKKVR